MASKRISGRDLMLFKTDKKGVADNGAFAAAKTCSINLQTEFEELSDKDTAETVDKEPKKLSWSADTSNLIADVADVDELYQIWHEKKALFIAFSSVANASSSALEDVEGKKWKATKTSGFFGKVYIESLTVTAQSDGKAELSISFAGVGELKPLKTGGYTVDEATE